MVDAADLEGLLTVTRTERPVPGPSTINQILNPKSTQSPEHETMKPNPTILPTRTIDSLTRTSDTGSVTFRPVNSIRLQTLSVDCLSQDFKGRMDALIDRAKVRWQEGVNFCKLEEMLSGLDREKITLKGTRRRFDQKSTTENTQKYDLLRVGDGDPSSGHTSTIPISQTATPFELPATDKMMRALAEAQLKLGPSDLGDEDVRSSLFDVLLQDPTRQDPSSKVDVDNLRAWLALHISNCNTAVNFKKNHGRDLDTYVEQLALTAGAAQLSGDEVSIMHAAVYQPGPRLAAIDVWVAGQSKPYRFKRRDMKDGRVINIALMSLTKHGAAFRSVGVLEQQQRGARAESSSAHAALRPRVRLPPSPPLDPAAVFPCPIKGATKQDGFLYLVLDSNVFSHVAATPDAWRSTFERLYREQRGCVRLFIHDTVYEELDNNAHITPKKQDAGRSMPEFYSNEDVGRQAKRAINNFIQDFCFKGRYAGDRNGAEKTASGFVVLQGVKEYMDSKKTWEHYELGVGHEMGNRKVKNDDIIRAFTDHCVNIYGRGSAFLPLGPEGLRAPAAGKHWIYRQDGPVCYAGPVLCRAALPPSYRAEASR